jgi:hypothetical protein
MTSATEQTVEAFSRWLDEIVARGDWPAERAFIADGLTIHSETGTRRLTRDQYMQWVLSTRPLDWRLTVHDLVAQGDRIGHAFTVSQTDPRTGTRSDRHGIEVSRFAVGKFAEIWIAPLGRSRALAQPRFVPRRMVDRQRSANTRGSDDRCGDGALWVDRANPRGGGAARFVRRRDGRARTGPNANGKPRGIHPTRRDGTRSHPGERPESTQLSQFGWRRGMAQMGQGTKPLSR